MQIVTVSNFYNHHQAPLANAFNRIQDCEYCFIATEELPEERKNLGYESMNDNPLVKKSYDSKRSWDECKRIITDCDICIYGLSSAPYDLIKDRIGLNKLTFLCTERIFKKNSFEEASIKRKIAIKWHHSKFQKKNVYVLCASAYTAYDFTKLKLYKDRMYKWGYFPEIDYKKTISKSYSDGIIRLLWVGRFIDWKHPEIAVDTINGLIEKGISNIHLDMIGVGEMVNEIRDYVKTLDLTKYVSFLGSMKPSEVRSYMSNSHIFLFTSDQNEGWGVVLNEAMESGCIPIANEKIGSVPYLIQNGSNGFVYNDYATIPDLIIGLINNKAKQTEMSCKSVSTVRSVWNPEFAANRMYTFCDSFFRTGYFYDYQSGPLSKE